MIRVDGILGNVETDGDLASRVEGHDERGTLETVAVDGADRQKSRLRVETDAGTDLGVLVDDPPLSPGDVLLCDDDRAVVVTLEERTAVVAELPDGFPPAVALELGHRIGNHHWDIAVEESTLYVPLDADRHIVEGVLAEYLPDATTKYETVDATLFLEDGIGADHKHTHGREAGHAHDQKAGHTHEHDHRPGDGDVSHAEGDRQDHSHGGDGHSHGGDGHSHDHEDGRDEGAS
ncbi:MAG: urease accessory protein UreE [Natronomonas sp.]